MRLSSKPIKNFWLLAVVLCFNWCCGLTPRAAAGEIVESGSRLSALFWTQRNPQGDQLILDATGVQAYNQLIVQQSHLGVVDLESFPREIARKSVLQGLDNDTYLDQPLYLHHRLMTVQEKQALQDQKNRTALPETIAVRYAILVHHTSVREFPLEEGLYQGKNDVYYDALQDTAAEPSEAAVVLHTSLDGRYYYVQLYNVRGWVKRADLALCSRESWLRYAVPKNFLVVAAKDYLEPVGKEKIFHLMGARILLQAAKSHSYQVLVPERDRQGNLIEKKIWLPKTSALHRGYLPYTSNNILKEAFQFLGNVYGWGNSFNSVDCSGLVNAVYRTMGVILPRNTAQLRNCPQGNKTYLQGAGYEQRRLIYSELQPGDTINLPHHVVMYLGQYQNKPYVIHAASSFYEPSLGMKKIYVRRVLVSSLNLHVKNGKTFADEALLSRGYTFDRS